MNPLIDRSGIISSVRNRRRELSTYLIVGSTLFQRIGYYIISVNFVASLGINTPFH